MTPRIIKVHGWGQRNAWWIITVFLAVWAVFQYAGIAKVQMIAKSEAKDIIASDATIVRRAEIQKFIEDSPVIVRQDQRLITIEKATELINTKIDRLLERK